MTHSLSLSLKANATTANVKAMAGSQVLNRIGTKVLLDLHDRKIVPGLLNNAESWSLNKSEEDEIEKIEVQTLKNLFDLPLHTPTVAILYSFGILHTRQKIEIKMLTYLHKMVLRNSIEWMKTLSKLESLNLGWHKKIRSILEKYDLPTDVNDIRSHTINQWKRRVHFVIENESRARLNHDCYKKDGENLIEKTKTKSIINKITSHEYTRSPCEEFLLMTKQETKTILMARFGMLVCGANYKGTESLQCTTCNLLDNEDHRLNTCKSWHEINFYNEIEKIPFDSVYSNDTVVLRNIIPKIEQVWNTRTAHGSMNTL